VLTDAFGERTNQIIKLAGQEAEQTRKAANSQTKAIQAQVDSQEQKLEDASLGSNSCPTINADHFGSKRPFALSVFNADKERISRARTYLPHMSPCVTEV
jgi:hypothetical protein